MRKIDLSALFIITAILISFILIYNYSETKTRSFEKNNRFTVAYIDEIRTLSRGAPIARYSYYYFNRSFHGSISLDSDEIKKKATVGRYIYIKVSCEDPEYSDYMLEPIVTDSNPPRLGWKTLPKSK